MPSVVRSVVHVLLLLLLLLLLLACGEAQQPEWLASGQGRVARLDLAERRAASVGGCVRERETLSAGEGERAESRESRRIGIPAARSLASPVLIRIFTQRQARPSSLTISGWLDDKVGQERELA